MTELLPIAKLERWKYTNLPTKLKKMDLVEKGADIQFSGNQEYLSSFPDALDKLPDWVKETVARPAPGEEKYKDMMLWQAANDSIKDGFIIDVPADVSPDKAIDVKIVGQEDSNTTVRQIIRVAENASLTLIENQEGEGAYWNNIVTQIELAKNARFYHYRFQNNSNDSVITHNTHLVMSQASEYEAFTFTGGAKLSRHQVHVDMQGAHGVCRLNGVNLINGQQHADTTITVEHQAPHCQSFQNYRTVADDKAVGVYQGKIHVHQVAQKTDGYQMAKSLLLSSQSTVNTKPELEIYADDVKCSHGATTGQLDKDAQFYLQSRGVPEGDAKRLLIEAFLSEVIEEISNENVRENMGHVMRDGLMAGPKEEGV